MILYPAIDIRNGYCVRLQQGDFNKETRYDLPEKIGLRWKEAGAKYLHLVDLDGAVEGRFSNEKAIEAIKTSTGIKVQLGGGIRRLEDIDIRLSKGVDRVILGTVAVINPELVSEAITIYGKDKIVVGIDAKDGKVAYEGWKKISQVSLLEMALDMKSRGVETLICTDISKDGMLGHPNFEQLAELVNETGMSIIASGGVSSIEDLVRLKEIGCSGAIIGKALFTGHICLEKAFERMEQEGDRC